MATVEKLVSIFEDCFAACNIDEQIAIHNTYCQENDSDNMIFQNDKYFFATFFENVLDAVRAVCYGSYQYTDEYVWFDGYGNLESTSFGSELPFDDTETMANYFIENSTDLSSISGMEDFLAALNEDDDEEDEEDE